MCCLYTAFVLFLHLAYVLATTITAMTVIRVSNEKHPPSLLVKSSGPVGMSLMSCYVIAGVLANVVLVGLCDSV